MRLFYPYIFLFFVFLLHGFHSSGNNLPVLPYPQYVEPGEEGIQLSSGITFSFKGIDKDVSTRLKDHWKSFTRSTKVPVSQSLDFSVILMGKNLYPDFLPKKNIRNLLIKLERRDIF